MPQTIQEMAVAGGIGIVTGGFGIWFKHYLDHKKQHTVPETIADMAAVYDVLWEARSKYHVDRALVLYTSNGGGIPSPQNTVTTTILYELSAEGITPIRSDWQHIPLDEAYVRMLTPVVDPNRGYWEGTPSDLEDGFLKTLYKTEGVKYGTVFALNKTPKKFFFASFRWINEDPPNENTRAMMRTVLGTKLKDALGAPK